MRYHLSPGEIRDLARARTYLRDVAGRTGVPVFTTVEEACTAIVEKFGHSSA
jgi:hypothetical protein